MCIIIADNYGAIALRNILKQMDIYTIGMQILIIFWHSSGQCSLEHKQQVNVCCQLKGQWNVYEAMQAS